MDPEQRTARKLIRRSNKNDKTGQPVTDELSPREIKEREQTIADVEATKAAIMTEKDIHCPSQEKPGLSMSIMPADGSWKSDVTQEDEDFQIEFELPKTPEEVLSLERKMMFGDIERRFTKHATIAQARGHRTIANDLRQVAAVARAARKRVFSAEYWK